MIAEPGDRMFAGLPAVFRDHDETGDLAALLAVFEALFFGRSGESGAPLPGIEAQLPAIPALFAPGDAAECAGASWRTPDTFLHWLASWLSFTPHTYFGPEALRRIVAGIVPLYGLRGTRDYLSRLLELCFGTEFAGVHLDDRPRVGFMIGESTLGVDTRLARSRPFWFKVVVDTHAEPHRAVDLERRLRAVIDFAKPAHTAYELQWRTRPPAAGAAPVPHEREAEPAALTAEPAPGE